MPQFLYGSDAISHVEAAEGPLSPKERRIVELEGYSDGVYLDTKGVPTTGVGQTGQFQGKSVKESVAIFEDEARKMISKYDELPENLQTEILQAAYRGDLQNSPKTRALINEGDYAGAAQEFLNNDEYRTTQSQGIRTRMEDFSNALAQTSNRVPVDTTPSLTEQKQVKLQQNSAAKQEAVAEKSARKQMLLSGLSEKDASILDQDLISYVNSGDPSQAGMRAQEYLTAQQNLTKVQAKREEENTKVLFDDLDKTSHYVGNTALSALNTVANIAGGLASLPPQVIGSLGLSGITDEDIKTYRSIVEKQEAGVDLSEAEQKFMQAGGRKSDSIVGQLQSGNFIEANEEVGQGESKFDQINLALNSLGVAEDISNTFGFMDEYVNKELTGEFVADAKASFDDLMVGNASAGEFVESVVDILKSPGAIGQATIESLPYIFASAYNLPLTVASSFANNQREAMEEFAKGNEGKLPTGDALANLTAYALGQSVVDHFGDRIVGGDALSAFLKGKPFKGADGLELLARPVAGALGEFAAEGGADLLGQKAATAGEGELDLGQAFGSALLGAASGGTTAGTIAAAEAGTSETAKKAVKSVKSEVTKEKEKDKATETPKPDTPEGVAKAVSDIDAEIESIIEAAQNKDSSDASLVDDLKRINELKEQKELLNTPETETQEDVTVAPQADPETTKKVEDILGSVELGESTVSVEQVEEILNNSNITLSDLQRARLNKYVTTETTKRNLRGVNQEIIEGSKNPDGSIRNLGVNQYLQSAKAAFKAGDETEALQQLIALKIFRNKHSNPLRTGVTAKGETVGEGLRKIKTSEADYMDAAVNEIESLLGLEETKVYRGKGQKELDPNSFTRVNKPAPKAEAPVQSTSDFSAKVRQRVGARVNTIRRNPEVLDDLNETQLNLLQEQINLLESTIPGSPTKAQKELLDTARTHVTNAQAKFGGTDGDTTSTEVSGTDSTGSTTTGDTGGVTEQQAPQASAEDAPVAEVATPEQIREELDRFVAERNAALNAVPKSDGTVEDTIRREKEIKAVYEQYPNEEYERIRKGEVKQPSKSLSEELTEGGELAQATNYVRDVETIPNYRARLRNILKSLSVGSDVRAEVAGKITDEVNKGAPLIKVMKEIIPEYTGKAMKFVKKAKELAADIKALDRSAPDRGQVLDGEQVVSANWIKEFFTSTKAGKNIIQSTHGLFKGDYVTEAEKYVGRELTNEEVEQLHSMARFTKLAGEALNDLYAPEFYEGTKNPKYHNLMSYLTDEQGNLHPGVIEAITVTAYNWMINDSSDTLFNDDTALRKLLGDNSDNPMPVALTSELRTVGQTQTAIIKSLGSDARKLVGVTSRRNAGSDLNDRLEASLGLATLHTMQKAGIVTIKNIQTTGLDLNKVKSVYPASNLDEKTTFVRVRVKPSEDGRDSLEPRTAVKNAQDIARAARESAPKGEKNLTERLFGLQSRRVFPSFEKPKGVATKVQGVRKFIPDALLPKILKQNQVEHYTKESNLGLLDALGPYTLRALGQIDPESVHTSMRDKIETYNQSIERTWTNTNEFRAAQTAQEEGVNSPFYFQLTYWKNGRWGIKQNVVNPQTNKIQRSFITQKDWKVDLDMTNEEHMMQFWASMDEHLGIDKESDLSTDMSEAINILYGYLDTNTISEGNAARLADLLHEIAPNPNPQNNALKLDDLLHIAKFLRARDKGESSFAVEKFLEIDGKTNGMAITLMQYGVLKLADLARFGYFTEDGEHTNFADYKADKGKDIYNALADIWRGTFDKAETGPTPTDAERQRASVYLSNTRNNQPVPEALKQYLLDLAHAQGRTQKDIEILMGIDVTKRLHPKSNAIRVARKVMEGPAYNAAQLDTIRRVFGLLKDDGVNEKAWRNIAKSPLMVIFYGSGFPAVSDSIKLEFIDKISAELNTLAQKGDVAQFNAFIDSLNALMPANNQIGRVKVNASKEDMLNHDFDLSQQAALEEALSEFSDLAGDSVQRLFPEYLSMRDKISDTTEYMYRMQEYLREILIKEKTKEAVEKGLIVKRERQTPQGTKSVILTQLPQHMLDEIDETLAKIAPHFFSNKSKDGDIDNAVDISRTVTEATSNQAARVPMRKPSGGITTKTTVATQTVPTSPGVSAVGISVHNLDSEDQIGIMGGDKSVSGVHDAILVGLTDAKEVGTEFNKVHWNTMEKNTIPVSMLEAFSGALQEFNRIVAARGESVDAAHMVVEGAFNSGRMEDDKTTARQVLAELAQVARTAEAGKREIMGNIAYVNQYADHNGISSYKLPKNNAALKSVEDTVNPVETAAIKAMEEVLEGSEETQVVDVLATQATPKGVKTEVVDSTFIYHKLTGIVNKYGNRKPLGSLASVLNRSKSKDLTLSVPENITDEHFVREVAKNVDTLKRPTARQQDLHNAARIGDSLGSATVEENFSIDPADYNTSQEGIDATNVDLVFESLPESEIAEDTVAHRNYLKGMVQRLANKLTRPFALHMRNVENESSYGIQSGSDVFINRMVEGTEARSGMIVRGIPMTTHEIMAHELNHVVFAEGFKVDSRYRRQLERIFKTVKAQADFSLFLDDPVNATAQEIEGAKKTFDYLFNNKSGNALAEFGAFATTNAKMIAFTNNISMANDKLLAGDNAYEKIVNLLNRIIDTINLLVLGLKRGSKVDQLMGLMAAMNNISTGKEAGIARLYNSTAMALDKGMGLVNATLDTALKPVVSAMKPLPVIGPVAKLVSVGVDEKTKKAYINGVTNAMNKARDKIQGQKFGMLEFLMREAAGRTDSNKEVYDLRRKNNLILDADRKRTKNAYTHAARDGFTTEVSKEEWASLGKAVLRIDLDAISSIGVTAIRRVLQSPEVLQGQINEIEAQLATSPYANWMIRHAKNIGHMMVTGESKEEFALRNAYLVVRGKGNPNMTVSEKDAARYQPLVDRLATLYGIKNSSPADIARVVNLIGRDAKGVQNIINLHAALKKQAESHFSTPLEFNTLSIKGWTKDLADGHSDVKVATMDEATELAAQGYIRLPKPIPNDNSDPTNNIPRYIFVNKDGALDQWMGGLVSMTSNVAKGTDTVGLNYQAGFSNATQAGMVDVGIINKRKQAAIADMNNSPNPPLRRVSVNPMIPIMSPHSDSPVGWRYEMSESTKENHLGKNYDAGAIIGAMGSNVVDKVNTPKVNREVVEMLKEVYDRDRGVRDSAYVVIGPDSKGQLKEYYDMLPQGMKDDIVTVFGTSSLPIRNDLVLPVFGSRSPSLTEILNKSPESRKAWESIVAGVLKAFTLGTNTISRVTKAENFLEALTQEVKSIIVVKSIVVPLFNILSNTLWLIANGVNPITVIPKQLAALTASNRLNGDLRAKKLLEVELGKPLTQAKRTRIVGEIAQLDARIKSNPVYGSYSAGLMPTIVDDVAEDLEVDTSLRGRAHRKISKGVDKILSPEGNVTGALGETVKSLIGTQDSVYVKTMNNLVMNTDFVGRHIAAEQLKADKEKQLNRSLTNKELNDIYGKAEKLFVSFDSPTHRGIEYLNKVGFAWFTKYMLRNTGAVASVFINQPLALLKRLAFMQLGLGDVLTETPVGSAVPFRNPLNVLDDPITVAIDASGLWAPLNMTN